MTETERKPFFKSVKYKRLSSLLDGFISGSMLGIVIAAIMVSQALKEPIPAETVTWLLIAVVFSVAIFVWGIHSAVTTKEEKS